MMKLNRLLAALLALMMLLTLVACGGDKAEEKETAPVESPSASAGTEEESAEPAMSEEEKAAFYQEKLAGYTQRLAGLDPDETVMTVNGEEISAALYLYWLAYDCMYWDSVSRYMNGTELDFNADSGYGVPYKDYLKDEAVQMLLSYVVLFQHAEEEGCRELTEEQKNAWNSQVEAYKTTNGEAEYQYLVAQSGTQEELFADIQTCSNIYDNLCVALNGEPSEAEMEMYIKQKDLLRAKHILIGTAKDGENGTIMRNSDGTVINGADGKPYQGGAAKYNAEALAKANDLYNQLQSADDPFAVFDELMLLHSEDPGSQSNPQGYDFSAGQMVEEFEQTTRDLEYGEISKPVESSFGYHIILRLKPEVREEYLDETMNLYLDNWMYKAEVEYTDAFEQLDVEAIYKEYVAYQEELLAVRNS